MTRPNEPDPDTNHPTLAAALVAAQGEAKSLKRDGKNQHGGYKYATADQVADLGRQLLTRHGLAWSRLSHRLQAPTLALADIGNQTYVGDVVICWALRHGPTGETLAGEAAYPVICSKQRPHEKATAASVTYGCGQIIQGVLCWDREDERHAVDRRADGEDDEPPAPKPSKAKPAAPPVDNSRVLAGLASLVKASARATTPAAVWAYVADQAGWKGLALDSLTPESLADCEQVIERLSTRAKPKPKSSPDHAGAVARVQQLADQLARVREWEIEQVLADELRGGVTLASLSIEDLHALGDRLAVEITQESEEAP
jgi:hypothetical protein